MRLRLFLGWTLPPGTEARAVTKGDERMSTAATIRRAPVIPARCLRSRKPAISAALRGGSATTSQAAAPGDAVPGMADLPGGRGQFRDLTSCVRLFPEPGGRDLAEVALADLAMTHPETARPHQGRHRLSDFFLSIGT